MYSASQLAMRACFKRFCEDGCGYIASRSGVQRKPRFNIDRRIRSALASSASALLSWLGCLLGLGKEWNSLMNVSPRRTVWRDRIAPLIGALLVLGASALAQVRPTSDYSPFDPAPNNATRRTFGPGGLAGIAGGVLFQGNARFFRE